MSTPTETATHTPAPWTWDGTFPITIRDAEGYYVVSPGGIVPSGEANARLITSAPGLLAALKALTAPHYGNPAYPEINRTIRANALAAIAKAEGK